MTTVQSSNLLNKFNIRNKEQNKEQKIRELSYKYRQYKTYLKDVRFEANESINDNEIPDTAIVLFMELMNIMVDTIILAIEKDNDRIIDKLFNLCILCNDNMIFYSRSQKYITCGKSIYNYAFKPVSNMKRAEFIKEVSILLSKVYIVMEILMII